MPTDPLPTLASPAAPSHLDPGSTLAGRYRIITTLGKGGMGEVYRADDLTLGVSVALKFLPPSFALDPLRLEHFRSEVRLARQVSHPNVCRVFDILESDGRIFLSMEYVDGEDLSGLLRRIGRLPSDKAVQIARQLCFGLAAAHEQGIIHRDLKPANVMLDGRGQARIMDFGIAGVAADFANGGQIAGTPGYMSPEQLSGGEVTKRSDLYSLGVLLYELFTGRPVFTATAIEELRKQQSNSTKLTRPSAFIADIDPAVERIILQCLEPDPKDRPPSAMSIAAALPGGDPLAAALAAGETPSPELIAAAGETDALRPAQAIWRAVLIVAMLAGVVLVTAPWTMVALVKPAKSPAILEDRVGEMLRDLGYTEPPVDSARGMNFRIDLIRAVNRDQAETNKVSRLRDRPGVYEFWYRRSPTPIRPPGADYSVSYQSPFPSQAGEILVRTDSSGNLENLIALPPRVRSGPSPEVSEDTLKKLFTYAGLDFSTFTSAEPTFRSFVPSDNVKAWTGTLPGSQNLELRVHVGSIEGRVNHFLIHYPFSPQAASGATPAAKATATIILEYAAGVFFLAILVATAWLALDNLRSNRGDRTTSFRLAIAMFIVVMTALVFGYHALPSARVLFFQGVGVAPAIFTAFQFWLFYTALEPYARRVYPHALVSWTRLARGGWNDALVGRHILLGLMLGAASVLCTSIVAYIFHRAIPENPTISIFGRTGGLLAGAPGYAANSAGAIITALMAGTGTMLPLVLTELASKRRWLGYLMLMLSVAIMNGTNFKSSPIDTLLGIAIAFIPVLAIPTGGLLALFITHLTIFLGLTLPVGLDWTHWFTRPVLIPAGIFAALVLLSTRAAAFAKRSR